MIRNLFKKKENKQVFCQICKHNSNDWITGIVSSVNLKNSVAKIFLHEKYLNDYFYDNDKINLKLIKDGKEFVFNGYIDSKNISPIEQSIIININEIKFFSNHRKNERFNYNSKVVINDVKNNQSDGTLCDIGIGGISFITNNIIDDCNDVYINVLPMDEEQISFTAEIVRKITMDKCSKYALRIKFIDENNLNALNKIITFLPLEKYKIINEWDSINKANLKASMIFKRSRL